MRRLISYGVMLLMVSFFLVPMVARGQSLGEIARKLRAERQAEGKKPVKVYTNDTIPHSPASQPATPESATASTQGTAASGPQSWNPAIGLAQKAAQTASNAGSSTLGTVMGSSAQSKMKTKAYWQARFRQARARLARAKEEQTLDQNELSLLQLQKQQTLNPNLISTLSKKIAAKQSDLAEKEAATAKAQKALDELKQEFKASGAPADWSETP